MAERLPTAQSWALPLPPGPSFAHVAARLWSPSTSPHPTHHRSGRRPWDAQPWRSHHSHSANRIFIVIPNPLLRISFLGPLLVRVTNALRVPRTCPDLALKVQCSWKPLSPRQTGTAGHPPSTTNCLGLGLPKMDSKMRIWEVMQGSSENKWEIQEGRAEGRDGGPSRGFTQAAWASLESCP